MAYGRILRRRLLNGRLMTRRPLCRRRLTTRAVEHAKTVANAYVALAGELRRVPSTAEVAQRVRMSGAMVESLVLSIRRGKSLDMTFGDGDEEGSAAGLPVGSARCMAIGVGNVLWDRGRATRKGAWLPCRGVGYRV